MNARKRRAIASGEANYPITTRVALGAVAVASLLWIASAGAARTDTRMINLSSGVVDGHRVLGRTVSGVTAGLGRPDFRAGSRSHFRIGWGSETHFAAEVLFRPSAGVERAWSIVFTDAGLVADIRIGDLLNRPPLALQKLIAADYPSSFRLVRAYSCNASKLCVGDFGPRTGTLHVAFGRQPSGRWLTVWR